MQKYRAMALSALVLSVLLSAGCGPSTTNEENVDRTKAPDAGGGGGAKNYGEFAKIQQEKAAKALQDAKAKPKASGAPTKTE